MIQRCMNVILSHTRSEESTTLNVSGTRTSEHKTHRIPIIRPKPPIPQTKSIDVHYSSNQSIPKTRQLRYEPCMSTVRPSVCSIVSQPSQYDVAVRPFPPGLPPDRLIFAPSRSQRPSSTPTARRNAHECCEFLNKTRGVYYATLRTHTSVLKAPISTVNDEHTLWLHPIRKVLLVHHQLDRCAVGQSVQIDQVSVQPIFTQWHRAWKNGVLCVVVPFPHRGSRQRQRRTPRP